MNAAADSAPLEERVKVEKVITWQWLVLAGFLILFTGVYFYLATFLIERAEAGESETIEQQTVRVAHGALERAEEGPATVGLMEYFWRRFPHYTDGVTEPLWPWIASKFAVEDGDEFLRRGRWAQVILTASFCCVLGLSVVGRFTLAATLNVVCLAGFGSFMKGVALFSGDSLFNILFFLSWVTCIIVLRRNANWIYLCLGLLLGLAYLANVAVVPLLIVCVVMSTVHWVESLMLHKRRMRRGEGEGKWMPQNHFIGLVILAGGFFAVSGARMHYSAEAFGSPWHSYPAFWIWLDSEEEARQFTWRNPDAEALERIPAGERPTMGNYLREHGPEERKERLFRGVDGVVRRFFLPEGEEEKGWVEVLPKRGYYLAALFVTLCVAGCASKIASHDEDREKVKADARSARLVVVFLLAATLFYVAGIGWYAAIKVDDRYMTTLFLPLAFSFTWGVESLLRRMGDGHGGKALRVGYMAVHLMLLCAICLRVAEIVRDPTFAW